MKTAITEVVPQPGATLPYSEFKGLSTSPNQVRCAMCHLSMNLKYLYYDKKNDNLNSLCKL